MLTSPSRLAGEGRGEGDRRYRLSRSPSPQPSLQRGEGARISKSCVRVSIITPVDMASALVKASRFSREQRGPEPVAAEGGVEVAPEWRRLGRPDPQHDEGGAVALADQARARGDVGFRRHRVGALDAGAGRHLFEVDAEARVALLPAGLAVMAVVDADDREVGRVDHSDGGE